ncbi:helix-turn-helix domain-containing protein [Streptomyces xiamenensis]|uniref:helix-turn-helix domain-containing protein n=1 Tax=Streptomyces xiamenensis TaxID=408015 RepID=UPI0035E035F8
MDDALGMRQLMQTWRARVDVSTLPGIEDAPRYLAQRGRLTQALMAHLLGVHERHYRRLEFGEGGFSTDIVERCAEILGLNSSETEALYVWCGHVAPQRQQEREREPIPEHLVAMLHQMPTIAYWADSAYYVLECNSAAGHHWPWIQRPNFNPMVEFLAADSEARRACVDWDTVWLPLMIAQLRHAALQLPHNRRLQDVVRAVRRQPEARAAWDADERAEVRQHAYGTHRRLQSAVTGGPIMVAVEALVPLVRPDLRMIWCPILDQPTPELPYGPPRPPEVTTVADYSPAASRSSAPAVNPGP